MESTVQLGVLAIAAGGGVATFIVARNVLRDQSTLSQPTALAACIAVMSFIGLLSMGPTLLLVFGAFGFICLALPFVRYLYNQEIIRLRSREDVFPVSRIQSHPPTSNVPSNSEQPRPKTSSRTKTPAQSPPVIPLIIQRPDGATRNGKNRP